MKVVKRIVIGAAVAVGTVMLILGYFGMWDSPVIRAHNASGVVLTDIVFSGTGFTETVPRLGPGEVTSITVRPRGASGLAVSFRARDRAFEVRADTYFEGFGGYKVRVDITPDFRVFAKSSIGRFD